jgi:hypothetical protein
MGPLLDRSEVKLREIVLGTEDLLGDLREKGLKLRFESRMSRRGTEHEGLP